MSYSNGTISSAGDMTLQDITVTDTTGVLQLPFVSNFVWEDAPAGLKIAPYETGVQTISVPAAKVVVASNGNAGSVTLAADGMELVNNGTMSTVGVNGDNCTVENNGTMGRVTANGVNAQIMNNADANCNVVSFYSTGAELNNYGTITATSTHTLCFGKQNDETAMPTAVVNNYGTITGADGQYLFFAPRFTSVIINNMTGSTMKQPSSWFIAYGSDNNNKTTGEFAGTKGVFNFNYVPGTVVNSSDVAQTVTANYFVGHKNSDLDLNISDSEPVAKIGNNYYSTLKAAIDEAQPGDTVTLLSLTALTSLSTEPIPTPFPRTATPQRPAASPWEVKT